MTIYSPEVLREKANDNLRASKLCLKNKHYDAVANRSYYAVAQFSVSLLVKYNISLRSNPNHQYIISMFKQRFGKSLSGVGTILETLLAFRMDADYTDSLTSSKKAVFIYQQASEAINRIKNYERS